MGKTPEPEISLSTIQDLERLSAAGRRFELIRGELRPMPPAGGLHGSMTKRLDHFLTSHIYGNDLGECATAGTGFLISQEPPTVLAPDWAYVEWSQLPDPFPDGFVPVVPDVALETRSPGDTDQEVADRMALWLDAGVRAALDLDPGAETLVVHRPGGAPVLLRRDDTMTLEEILPGFALPLRDLFGPASHR